MTRRLSTGRRDIFVLQLMRKAKQRTIERKWKEMLNSSARNKTFFFSFSLAHPKIAIKNFMFNPNISSSFSFLFILFLFISVRFRCHIKCLSTSTQPELANEQKQNRRKYFEEEKTVLS